MKKLYILSLLVFGLVYSGKAQYSMDFGINLGSSHYIGEIGNGGAESFTPFLIGTEYAKTGFNAGGFFRYNFTDRIGAKISANYVRIAGADSLSDEPTRIARNLSFRTDILEASLMGEYTFFIKNDVSRGSRIDFRASAYAGIGYMLFYPQANLNDSWVSLRPLATEGIENAYGEGSLLVPIGIAANFTFSKKIRVGLDLGYRMTFTDYLDDISTDYAYVTELPFAQSVELHNRSAEAFNRGNADLPDRGFYVSGSRRGNPDTNDGYFLIQAQISYVIDLGNSFYRSRYNSIINRRRKRTKF